MTGYRLQGTKADPLMKIDYAGTRVMMIGRYELEYNRNIIYYYMKLFQTEIKIG